MPLDAPVITTTCRSSGVKERATGMLLSMVDRH
jgi:hypothetical protein